MGEKEKIIRTEDKSSKEEEKEYEEGDQESEALRFEVFPKE